MIRTVAFIGLGTMGRPMALNVLKGAFALRAFDVVPAAVEALVRAGAAPAYSPAEAARGAHCVITMLPNGPQVEEAINQLAASSLKVGENRLESRQRGKRSPSPSFQPAISII